MTTTIKQRAPGRPFTRGSSGNPGGRPPLTDAQRAARDLRVSIQPEVVKVLYGIATDPSADVKDRIAAAKALLEDLPIEIAKSVEAEPERPLEELLAIGLGALVAKRRMGDNQSLAATVADGA